MTQNHPLRRLLYPFVPLYQIGLAGRELLLRSGVERVRRLRHPVISVGNLSVGGAGKTPFTIALTRLLQGDGFRVDVLSRGYGRKSRSASRVDPAGTAAEFGDEPLLIAREAEVPVYVAAQRYEAGLVAESEPSVVSEDPRQPWVHLLDDAFQHRQLARAVDILLLSPADWRDSLLPAGNLREAIHAATRADVLAVPAGEAEFEAELRKWGWDGVIWRLRRRMAVPTVDGPVAAFCAIARPRQFFDGLKGGGLTVCAEAAFPDHHAYSGRDLERLIAAARSAGAKALITTEKDRVRLEPLLAPRPAELPLLTAALRIEIEDAAGAVGWIRERLRTIASIVI
jgi:tetraacyldisaccharide 4'-kinase